MARRLPAFQTAVLLVLACTFVSAQEKILRKPSSVSSVLAKPAQKPKPPAEATVAANDDGYVDWSYLKSNHPGIVDAMLNRVEKGEANYLTLGGLGPMSKLKEYAGGTNDSKPATSPSKTSNPAVAGRAGASILRRPGAASTIAAKPSASMTAYLKALPALDVAPTSVDFGSIVDGQKVRKVIYVRNVPAGNVAAQLDTKSPFRILQVKVMPGRYEFVEFGLWKDSLIGTYAQEASGLSASNEIEKSGVSPALKVRTSPGLAGALTKPGASPKGAAAAVGIRTQPNVSATLAALAKREATEAPFEVLATGGATVRITLEFKPKFGLFGGDYVGRHNAVLKVSQGTPAVDVPLTARFEGVNLDVITIPRDREVTLLASPKQERHPSGGNMVTAHQKLRFGFGLTFLNPKSEGTVYLSGVDLPPGIRLINGSQQPVPNGTTQGGVDFEMDFWGDDRGAQYGLGQEILLRVIGPNSDRTISLTLNLLPAMRKFSCRGSLDNVYYSIDMMTFADGSIESEWDYHTTNAWPTDGEFKFSIDGVQMVHYSSIWMNSGNRMKAKGNPKFKVDQLAAEWERFVQKPGSFWIKVTEKFRL